MEVIQQLMNDQQTKARNQQTSPHLLQIPEWAELKSHFGWSSTVVSVKETWAQVLFRRLLLGFSIAYIPKGPVGLPEQWHNLWPELDSVCKEN